MMYTVDGVVLRGEEVPFADRGYYAKGYHLLYK